MTVVDNIAYRTTKGWLMGRQNSLRREALQTKWLQSIYQQVYMVVTMVLLTTELISTNVKGIPTTFPSF